MAITVPPPKKHMIESKSCSKIQPVYFATTFSIIHNKLIIGVDISNFCDFLRWTLWISQKSQIFALRGVNISNFRIFLRYPHPLT